MSVASRDIKDPLTAVMMFSKLLGEEKNGPLTEFQKQRVGEISKSSESMLKFISGYLDRHGNEVPG